MAGSGGQPTFAPPAAAGATMQAQYMGRIMKCYPVHEIELENLAALNTEATIFASVGSAFLAFGVGILTNTAFANELTPMAQFASKFGAPTMFVLAAVFYGLWILTVLRRRSVWERIKREAVTVQTSPVP